MSFNIKGIVKAALNVESGTSKAGNAYQKGGFVITVDGKYPYDIAFTLFGEDRIAMCPKVGEEVEVSFDLKSREYKGNWYHDVQAYKVEHIGAPQTAPRQQAIAPVPPAPQQNSDDLPF